MKTLSFFVPGYRRFDAEGRLEKLQKRAARYNARLAWNWGEPERVLLSVDAHERTYGQQLTVTLPIFIPGWRVVGLVEKLKNEETGESITVTRAITGGVEIPARDSMGCDHCATNRARKRLIVLRDESTGALRWVGAQCVRDYTGHSIGVNLFSLVGELDELGVELLQGNSDGETPVRDYLVCAAACTAISGFRKSSEFYSTKNEVESLLRAKPSDLNDEWKNALDGAEKRVDSIIEWITSVADDDGYLGNAKRAVLVGYAHVSTTGLLASIPSAYDREQARRTDEARKAASGHVGTIGERIALDVEYVRAIPYESYYGSGMIRIFRDSQDNILKCFHSGSANGCQVGERIHLRATVKKHDSYKGVRETIVNRPKMTALS